MTSIQPKFRFQLLTLKWWYERINWSHLQNIKFALPYNRKRSQYWKKVQKLKIHCMQLNTRVSTRTHWYLKESWVVGANNALAIIPWFLPQRPFTNLDINYLNNVKIMNSNLFCQLTYLLPIHFEFITLIAKSDCFCGRNLAQAASDNKNTSPVWRILQNIGLVIDIYFWLWARKLRKLFLQVLTGPSMRMGGGGGGGKFECPSPPQKYLFCRK